MTELNKIILIGRLTRDPELRYTPGGAAVAELRLAANHTYRTRDNEKREEVCFFDVSIFGRSAETAKQYLQKGREVLVEGRLKFDTWEGQDGQKRSKHSIFADRFQFIGSGRGERSAAAGADGGSYDAPAPAPGGDEDDLPF